MNEQFVPFGTKRRAKLEAIYHNGVHAVMDAEQQCHLLDGGAEDETARVGDEGVVEFVQGGETGGFWRFTKDPKRQSMSHRGVVRLRRQRKFYR